MIWAILTVVMLAGLLSSAFFSGSETGLYCINRLRAQVNAQRGGTADKHVASLLADRQGAMSTTLVGSNISNYITTATVAYACTHQLGLSNHEAEVYTVVILTPIVFVAGEVLPKNLFQLNAERLMRWGSPFFWASYRFLRATGVLRFFNLLTSMVHKLIPTSAAVEAVFDPKRRVATMLREALADEESDEEQLRLVDRVVRVSELQLHQVMVPRNRVVLIGVEAGFREVANLARRGAPSHVPVYDRHPRRIIGLVKIDTVLYNESSAAGVRSQMRAVPQLSPHESVADAITRLRKEHCPMGIIVDRGGMMLGMVTLKDLVEQITGELPGF